MLKKISEWILVLSLLFIGVYVRTYKLDAPLADWHSWREADTASVARNFVKDKFDMLYPQSDSFLALNEHNLPNPNRYFINEFPLYNAIVATLYKQFGVNEAIGRMVSIAFATMGAAALYGLVRLTLGTGTALLALGYYQLLPYNIYYSRVFMPDPTFVSLSILSLFLCVLWTKTNQLRYGIGLMIAFALAMLVKPYAIFMVFPIAYWLFASWGLGTFKKKSIYLLAIGAFIPLILWRYHYSLHPEGSFASTWLLNGDGIRFKGSFFRWLVYDRLNRLIFATGGFALFVIGLFTTHLKKNSSLFFVWTLAIFLYMTVFAKGNVNHDYYQLPIVAPGSVLIAYASFWLVGQAKSWFGKIINLGIVGSMLALSLAFGWFEVRGFFNINNPAIVEAGKKVDELTPKDAIVIAPYQGDPAFLYQTNRHGWPVGGDVEKRMEDGATYYVTTSREEEYNRLKKQYTLIYETEQFSIIHLVPNGKTGKTN
jgi:hypothetical protein